MNSDTNPDGFRGKHLCKVNYFLGMAIDQHADYSISVHQTKYIEKMLDKFVPSHSVNSVKHSKPCSPEAFARLSIAKDDNERERVSKLPYLQIIGSLLYLSTMTRPDISFYVTMLCKYMHDPSLECYDAAVSLLPTLDILLSLRTYAKQKPKRRRVTPIPEVEYRLEETAVIVVFAVDNML